VTNRISRAFIEHIHDVLVSLWMPFDEQVNPADYKDTPLLESAVNRPFQTFAGEDLFPSVLEKAAALFHSLVCNHGFKNGNKRTAVIALDFFLMANGYALAMSNQDVYLVATQTALANKEGRRADDVVADLTNTFAENTVPLTAINPNSEVAKQVGSERVERVRSRMAWFAEMITKWRDAVEAAAQAKSPEASPEKPEQQ